MDYKNILKKLGIASLAIVSPPVCVAQYHLRTEDYETRWGQAIGTAVLTGATALGCFIGSVMYNGGAISYPGMQEGIISEEKVQDQSQELYLQKREYPSMDSGMLSRSFIFPGEGLVRRFVLNNYPSKQDTAFFGIIKKRGLEIAVNGELDGWVNSSELTPELLSSGTKNARINSENYEQIYKRD